MDVNFLDAGGITKERARQLEEEARKAPRGNSPLSHVVISKLQDLPAESVGPLLKVVEEAKYARFIMQAQALPPKVRTLMSRAQVIRLPFLTKRVVLGNLSAMNYDAKTVDQLGLWDGTLSGTLALLSMKDTLTLLSRETKLGLRGFTGLVTKEAMESLAYQKATDPLLGEKERAYLRRGANPARMKLALYQALSRRT